MPPKITLPAKACEVCGVMFAQRANEPTDEYRKRRSCSRECSNRLKAIAHHIQTPQRVCEVCDGPIVRGPNEASGHYDKRRVCSKKCAGILRWRIQPTNAKQPARDYGTRTCAICGSLFEKHPTEKPNRYFKRETCSKGCADVLIGNTQRFSDPVKFCDVCGLQLERYSGEGPAQFAVRMTCGGSCRMVRAWDTRLEQGDYAPRQYVRGWDVIAGRIRERDGYRCQICGDIETRLDVHHIDYDKANNADTNLITLCVSCHMKTNFRREEWQTFFRERAND